MYTAQGSVPPGGFAVPRLCCARFGVMSGALQLLYVATWQHTHSCRHAVTGYKAEALSLPMAFENGHLKLPPGNRPLCCHWTPFLLQWCDWLFADTKNWAFLPPQRHRSLLPGCKSFVAATGPESTVQWALCPPEFGCLFCFFFCLSFLLQTKGGSAAFNCV